MPISVRPQRRPQARTNRSVRNPPRKQAIPPTKSGEPDASASFIPVSRKSPSRYGVIQLTKNDQPALLQKYINSKNQIVGLSSKVRQESGAGLDVSRLPSAISARSAPLTFGSCCGVSRNRAQKNPTHTTPIAPITTNVQRQPNKSVSTNKNGNAMAPPNRASIQT